MVAQANGQVLIAGPQVEASLLCADVALSLWGGVDAVQGRVIDRHHPLSGASVSGRVLAIPGARGSCTGSCVMLEMLLNDTAPAALVIQQSDPILTLGVLVARELFGRTIPVVRLAPELYARLGTGARVRLISEGADARLIIDGDREYRLAAAAAEGSAPLQLDALDQRRLQGLEGRGMQLVTRILVTMASLLGAQRLIPISQAHIDGCIYTGPGSLRFAQALVELGLRVCVPTTLNAVSVDLQRWRRQGVDEAFGEAASALAEAYLALGASQSFTCAPYLRDSAPAAGEQVVWAESNAVVYANSVLAARTLKYPDFLDICIAITGRAPECGTHLDQGRRAQCRVDVAVPEATDDAFYPLLGYLVGLASPHQIPLVSGLQGQCLGRDELKAFGAAFATTSGAPMFHLLGITPEARGEEVAESAHSLPCVRIDRAELVQGWRELNRAESNEIDLVALGNPHCSLEELAAIARLCEGRSARIKLVITCSREVLAQAESAGWADSIRRFGGELVTDTCWCMIAEPLIPADARTLMTNSGKFAHYGPGLTGCELRFGSLAACIEAACEGWVGQALPAWLEVPTNESDS